MQDTMCLQQGFKAGADLSQFNLRPTTKALWHRTSQIPMCLTDAHAARRLTGPMHQHTGVVLRTIAGTAIQQSEKGIPAIAARQQIQEKSRQPIATIVVEGKRVKEIQTGFVA
ncbi:hypothetical protein, partial [Aquitalea magnusonii]|uniref:hypothetical protein n=1 Tax=Aquitalea magnusonii TaxID=332411 RepID=UPI0013797072